jgi:hypothetical protein
VSEILVFATMCWNSVVQHECEGRDWNWVTTFWRDDCHFCFKRFHCQLKSMQIQSPDHTVAILFTSTEMCCVEFRFVDLEDGMSEWTYSFWYWLIGKWKRWLHYMIYYRVTYYSISHCWLSQNSDSILTLFGVPFKCQQHWLGDLLEYLWLWATAQVCLANTRLTVKWQHIWNIIEHAKPIQKLSLYGSTNLLHMCMTIVLVKPQPNYLCRMIPL